MRAQHCDKCPKVTIGGFEHQAMCEDCAGRWAAYRDTFCKSHPDLYEELKPDHLTLLNWFHTMLGGGTCEPRRWLPQRWSVCEAGFTLCGLPVPCRSSHEAEALCYRRCSAGPTISEWHNPKDAGTCTPGVGPVCEVVA